MATQESNLGKVMKNIGKITLEWLSKYKVPYDEIYFGKPNAQVYIDEGRVDVALGLVLDRGDPGLLPGAILEIGIEIDEASWLGRRAHRLSRASRSFTTSKSRRVATFTSSRRSWTTLSAASA